jgi:hypothetical protein
MKRLIVSLGAAAALAAATLTTAGVTPALSATQGTGTGQNPSGGPVYTVTQLGNVEITGDHNPGFSSTYTPPMCWLQPWFYQPKSWQLTDPQPASSPQTAADAASFWFYIASQYPNLMGTIAHIPDARQSILGDFKMVQNGQNDVPGGPPVTSKFVWWGPNWLAGASGWACAQGLISAVNLNNGFLEIEPPQPPDNGTPHQISSQDLAGLARAALRLPAVTLNTSPSGATAAKSAYVNLPTRVAVTYGSNPQPSDTARVVFAGGGTYLQAQITTSKPKVTITTNDPGATITDNGVCSLTQTCSVKFSTPSAANPYVITATVTWTVRWATSDGRTGVFTNPPSVMTATRQMVVREIQTVTG